MLWGRPALPKGGKSAAYRIQLAAYVRLDDAIRGKSILIRRLPITFPRLGIFVRHRPTTPDKRTLYRLRSRDLINRSKAMIFCNAAKAAGADCLSIRQTDRAWRMIKTDAPSRIARSVAPRRKVAGQRLANGVIMVRKPVVLTAQRSPAKPAQSGPAAAPHKALFRIQFAAYRDLAGAVRGKQFLSNTSEPMKSPS